MSKDDKQGEAQVIEFFSRYIARRLEKQLGEGEHYTFANFSGSQDRRFGDVFCGTKSTNILIEFKEFRTERRAETKKPLRQKLCTRLTKSISLLSRRCHFVGWDKNEANMRLEFSPYIDTVCPLFTFLTPKRLLKAEEFTEHRDFSSQFLEGKLGVSHQDFALYIKELNDIAGGKEDGEDVKFKSFLYSLDEYGDVKATKFNSLKELKELRTLINKKEKELKNKRQSTMNFGM
ncbi:hypothetical protein [Vibrio neptunius]|uniref:hypothetical protein n=1 Tax=Vibrio neptunius TaxID=170651 RepID=UPI0019D02952|nr:hypothetical protein [Vibrio neptunius]MBN3573992.1 hypothetical protein [Vibrio neptunius]